MTSRDVTYREFAEMLGVQVSQLHNWMHTPQEPRLATLRKIAKRLDCDLFDLVEARAS
jgi:transcriptional regulator with XRE-family HTH domain